MKYWEFDDWCLVTLVLLVALFFGGGITCSVMESKKYAGLCHAKGGEVISGANQKLCRDGNTLINVYKEDSK